ncbi:MAG: cation:proton antiporter [Pseudomonadota bacterium]
MHQTEHILFATLLQLIVIVLAARIVGSLFRRFGQPAAVGEIVAGLLLGPSLLGHLLPGVSGFLFDPTSSMPITILSQIGLILLMFQIGSDFEFGHLSHARNRTAVIAIAIASVAAPFCLGFAIGEVSAPILAPGVNELAYSLFLGVALAITAVPILGRILREFDLTRTPIGAVAIAAAAINDVTGWVLLAGISAFAAAQFSAAQTLLQVGGIVGFAVVLYLAGRPAVDWLLRRFPVVGGELSPNLMAVTLATLFGFAICTYLLGIFAIFGGFAAGLLYHRHHEFVAAWRHQVGRLVLVFFLPVFFTYTGLRTNMLGLTTQADWLWCLLILGGAILGKILPSYLGARVAGFNAHEATVIGVLMNTRALMELIVLNVGFDLGIIPQRVFTMLVVMAVVTTIMTAPLLRIVLPRIGHAIPLRVEA